MTSRARRAIVNYWLSKRWQGVSPVVMLKLWRRHPRTLVLAATFMIASHCPLLAADTKSSPSSVLTSVAKAEKPVVKAAPKPRTPAFKPDMSKAKEIDKSVKGTVVYLRKDLISVEFAQSEEAGSEEMLIKLNAGVKMLGIKKNAPLGRGDLVEVKFKRVILPADKKDEAPRVLDTKATQITRLKTAAQIEAEKPKLPEPAALLQPVEGEVVS